MRPQKELSKGDARLPGFISLSFFFFFFFFVFIIYATTFHFSLFDHFIDPVTLLFLYVNLLQLFDLLYVVIFWRSEGKSNDGILRMLERLNLHETRRTCSVIIVRDAPGPIWMIWCRGCRNLKWDMIAVVLLGGEVWTL